MTRRGSLLIVTLWIVTILGALSVAVARYLSTEVRLTRYRLARSEARELARSGVLLAQQMIFLDDPQVDWSGEPWAETETEPLTLEPVKGRTLKVTITDEERKLNVNTATSAQLTLLLGDSALAQAIVDHVDPPAPEQEDRPTDDPPYYAKNGPIVVLEELHDLQNLDETAREVLAANATPHTSASQSGGPLNINTARREAMLAYELSEETVNRIDEVLRVANGRFEQSGTILSTLGWDITDPTKAREGTLLSSMMTASSFFLVIAEGAVEQPAVRVRIQAVLQRSTDRSVPKIIAWSER